MYNEYMKYLMEQFAQARGVRKINQGEFERWILEQQRYIEKYTSLLEYIGLSDNLIVEIGKGKHDTVVPNLIENYHNAIAITPFASTIDLPDKAYAGILYEHPSNIIYADARPIPKPSIHEVGTFITTLSTQSTHQIRAMITSYLTYHTGIWIGAYGSIHDKNMWENMANLESIKELLEGYSVSKIERIHETDQGVYVGVVKSKFKTKKLTLSK